MRKADETYGLIESGDRIAVGVSGGKDSLVLLKALAAYKMYIKKDFELISLTVDLGFDEKGRFADPRLVDEISFSRQFTPPDGKIEVDWKRNPGREDLAGKLRAFFDRIDAAETAARALRPPPSETGSFRLDGIPGGAEKTGPQWKELLTERGVEWPEDSWVGKARCAPGILCVRNTQGNLAKVRDILDSLRSEYPATNAPAASEPHADSGEGAKEPAP